MKRPERVWWYSLLVVRRFRMRWRTKTTRAAREGEQTNLNFAGGAVGMPRARFSHFEPFSMNGDAYNVASRSTRTCGAPLTRTTASSVNQRILVVRC